MAKWDDGSTKWDAPGVYWDNYVSGTSQQFDYSVDVLQALLWQYNDAENLQAILQAKQDWYDLNHKQFWIDWYNNVFNLATATDFGLSVWSYILNLPLSFDTPPDPTDKPTFGFGMFNQNFENGNFTSTSGTTTILTTDQKRIVLQLRYFQLVTSCTIPEVNRFLKYLFGNQGQAYLLDGNDMTQTYVFKFAIDPNLLQVIETLDLLPRPAGVESRIVIASEVPFGFGVFNENFYNSNFYN